MSNLSRVRDWVQSTKLAEFTSTIVAKELGLPKLYVSTHLRTLRQAGEIEQAVPQHSDPRPSLSVGKDGGTFWSGTLRKTDAVWRKVV